MKRMTAILLLCAALALAVPTAVFAAEKALVNGAIPSAFNLAKPKGYQGASEYPPLLGAGVTASGVSGGGTNRISFDGFDTGDICCVFGSGFGHAALYDGARYHGSLYNYCMVSANVSPADGVQLEQPIKFRHYDKAFGLWVPRTTKAERDSTRDWALRQMGEPYHLWAPKSDDNRWYCSKLVWAAYRHPTGKDLDANGGFWVSPADLLNDRDTALFAMSD